MTPVALFGVAGDMWVVLLDVAITPRLHAAMPLRPYGPTREGKMYAQLADPCSDLARRAFQVSDILAERCRKARGEDYAQVRIRLANDSPRNSLPTTVGDSAYDPRC
jgi:hypothetical protein